MKKNKKLMVAQASHEPAISVSKAVVLTNTPPGRSLYLSDKTIIEFMYIRADSALTWSLM